MKTSRHLIVMFLLLLPTFLFGQHVSIGDILCTDGSTVKPAQFAFSGKTAEGIVFYVNDSDTEGWAVALEDQSSSIKWSSEYLYGIDLPNLPNFADARVAMHDLDGYANTGIIRSQGNSNDFPAAWAVDYNNGWYLPSAGQLRYLYSYAPEINASLQVVGGTALPYHSNNYWWSSTEFTECHAYDMNTGGSLGDYVKDNHVNYPPNGIAVRQIKDFTIPNPVHLTYHIGDLITNDDGSQGILFYITPDQSDGWIVALNDASTSVAWGNGDVSSLANQTCSSPFGTLLDETDGMANTGVIRAQQPGLSTAANVVDYEHGWYLPTAGQLSKLFGAFPFIETLLEAHGTKLANAEYWSSTEADGNNAFTLSCAPSANVRAGHFVRRDKTSNHRVREVRNLSFSNPPLPDPALPDNIIEADCNQPLEGSPWNIQLLYSNSDNNVASYAPIIAGDINQDGIVDIVTARYSNSNYYSFRVDIHRGDNLDLQYSFSIPDTLFNSNGPYAIGRYPLENGTEQGAIFIHCNDKFIRSFAIDGTLLNVSDRPLSCDGMVSLADFNGDGYPEVYAGSDIFDAATLKWLCSGPANGNKGLGFRGAPLHTSYATHHTYYAMSLAYNILGDAKQELICGNTIYNVDIVSRTNPALNSITVNKTITPPSGFSQDGHVVLADFDLDGECDVLVIRDNTNDQTIDDTYFYAYKPSNGHILFQKAHNCRCTGYVTVGNIDNDPHPEMVFLEDQPNGSTEKIFCWRYTTQNGFETIWSQAHDDRSGQTGLTLFDFNQDGIMEIVYRDNKNLRVMNGSGKSHITGNDTICPYNVYARMMAAGTGVEYPIVVDVNGDGFAEIVATGMLDTSYTGQDIGYGGLHVFGCPGNWSPARPVWNQYMYHVTNVNEDLTIPTFCFDKATVFTGHDGTIRRPYNNFLQQAYYITPEGEPYNPGGQIEVDIIGSGCNEYTFNGITYDESGHYEQLVESPDGCDTLYNIEVNLGQAVTHDFWRRKCEEYTWNEVTYTESGNYQQTFESADGCDSIVTLHLTIIGTLTHEWSIEACDHYTWNGITYNEPGDYVQEFESVDGCDSIVTLHLVFSQAMEIEADTIACGSLSWAGQELTQSGQYDHMFVTPGGCDSLVHLHLTVLPYPEAVGPITGPTEVFVCTDLISGMNHYYIDSVAHATHYEWELEGADWPMDTTSLDCALWVTTPGDVILHAKAWNGCGYTEREILIHAGFYDINENQEIKAVLYPNPAQDKVIIEADDIIRVRIFDFLGRLIKERASECTDRLDISLQGLVPAIYTVEVQTIQGCGRLKLSLIP